MNINVKFLGKPEIYINDEIDTEAPFGKMDRNR